MEETLEEDEEKLILINEENVENVENVGDEGVHVRPRIFPGRLNRLNKGAMDWGVQNLIAYGAYSYIVVIDPSSMNIIQTLDEHRTFISCLKWCCESLSLNENKPSKLRLASGDLTGNIIIWNVLDGSVMITLEEIPSNNRIIQIEWNKTDPSILMVLYSSSRLVLWNSNTGRKIWKLFSKQSISSMTFDPFNPSKVFFSENSTLYSYKGVPLSSQYEDSPQPSNGLSPVHHRHDPHQKRQPTQQRYVEVGSSSAPVDLHLEFRVTSRDSGRDQIDQRKSHDKKQPRPLDILQAICSPNEVGMIYLLFEREVLIYDMEFGRAVGGFALTSPASSSVSPRNSRKATSRGRLGADLVSMFLFRDEPNFLGCLNQDGWLSGWTCGNSEDTISYDFSCLSTADTTMVAHATQASKQISHSDGTNSPSSRASSSSKSVSFPFSHCVHPFARSMAVATQDGTILLWEWSPPTSEFIHSLPKALPVSDVRMSGCSTPIGVGGRFSLGGLLKGISSPISSLSACPFPDSNQPKLGAEKAPSPGLVAVGTYSGTILIVDMCTNSVIGEHFLWPLIAVRGIRWLDSNFLLAFSCEENVSDPSSLENQGVAVSPKITSGGPRFRNKIIALDVRNGSKAHLRTTVREDTFPRGLRSSPSLKYLIVLMRDKAPELWDLGSFSLLQTLDPFTHVTSLEWLPPTFSLQDSDSEKGNERFIFLLADGKCKLANINSENRISFMDVKIGMGFALIASLAMKDQFIIGGDTTGTLHVHNCQTDNTSLFPTHKGMVRRLRFSPRPGDSRVIVLFETGEFGVWEVTSDGGRRVSHSAYLKGRDLKAVDCDWVTCHNAYVYPIVATNDGCIRVLDRSLSSSNSAFHCSELELKAALQLSTFMSPKHSPQEGDSSVPLGRRKFGRASLGDKDVIFFEGKGRQSEDEQEQTAFRIKLVPEDFPSDFRHALTNTSSIADRCAIVAQFFGDEEEHQFWRLVRSAFQKAKIESREDAEADSLPISYGLFLDGPSLHRLALQRVSFHSQNRDDDFDLAKKISTKYVHLGEKEKAMELLLESSLNFMHLRGQTEEMMKAFQQRDGQQQQLFFQRMCAYESLKAAVIASAISPLAFANSLKLIATNHIANGNVDAGVEMLCLIDKQFEACRYLQSYDKWEDACWLAKVSLSGKEVAEIVQRWVESMWPQGWGKRNQCMHLVCSGDFRGAMERLGDWDVAPAFLVSCIREAFLEGEESSQWLFHLRDRLHMMKCAWQSSQEEERACFQILTELKELCNDKTEEEECSIGTRQVRRAVEGSATWIRSTR